MPKANVRATYRANPGGVGTHKVKAHKRDVKGARKHAATAVGFQPVTPVRASCGALIGGATYWTFSGAMSVIALIGFSLTVAVGSIMGYSAVQKRRSGKRKRPVAVLRAKVKWSETKHRATSTARKVKTRAEKVMARREKWRKKVRSMPLGRRLNPVYRAKRWWKFRASEHKTAIRKRVDGWLETAYRKTHHVETTSRKKTAK